MHAAYRKEIGGHTRYIPHPKTGRYTVREIAPITEEIFLACKREWRSAGLVKEEHIVDNTNTITCKACAKSMGMAETRTDPVRYVIFKKSTGEYYKKGRFCSNPWVDDVGDATLYKVKGVAEKKTMRTPYRDLEGKMVPYKEALERIREGEQITRKAEPNPDLELRTVTLVVE